MGLTIHYQLATQRKLNPAAIRELIGKLRTRAIAMGFAEVGELTAAGPQYPWLYHRPPWAKRAGELVPAHDGWFFAATPGDGCESVQMGLCRFAGAAGWRMEGFCKTQYASRHGWEHFLKCHRGVIELLWATEKLGVGVKVEDEGRLWETGSHKVLRKILREYDQDIAAFSGALKDALAARGEQLEAPILSHPEFERLEAQGAERHGPMLERALHEVLRLSPQRMS